MYVESVPNRNSPPAILLRESSRLDGRVVKRTLANISDWPAAQIASLRRVLKGESLVPAAEAFHIQRSAPHGHIAAVLGTVRRLGLDRILARLTFPGAIFLAAVAALPTILISQTGAGFNFGGTSILIVIGVALDTMKQLEAQLMMRNYEGFLK